jgi:CBS-domain-containing membrane protein
MSAMPNALTEVEAEIKEILQLMRDAEKLQTDFAVSIVDAHRCLVGIYSTEEILSRIIAELRK